MCSLCTGLDWDKDGDILAIIQDKTGIDLQNYYKFIICDNTETS